MRRHQKPKHARSLELPGRLPCQPSRRFCHIALAQKPSSEDVTYVLSDIPLFGLWRWLELAGRWALVELNDFSRRANYRRQIGPLQYCDVFFLREHQYWRRVNCRYVPRTHRPESPSIGILGESGVMWPWESWGDVTLGWGSAPGESG